MRSAIVVVGAGQAGLQAAESLRAEGYEGRLLLVGDEATAPYHRPPLSKSYLLGETDEAQIVIRGPAALARKGIELLRDTRVTAIDRIARSIALSDGRTIAYRGIVIATGARPRPLPLPGANLAGVFDLRTLADARAVAAALAAAEHLVVIGGGFIGLEFAAVARQRGRHVTVLEAAARLMPRVVAAPISDFYAALHAGHGARVVLDAQVAEIVGAEGRAVAVRTADGTEYPADMVVAGIGIVPNTELASACGLACQNGIVVDACSRSSDPAIAAAGDCTVQRTAEGGWVRLESVQNAVEQAKSAAAALLGRERPFTASPWFWSDQYEVKLQMVGRSSGYDEVVTRGAVEGRSFSAFYFRQGRLLAIDSINQPGAHMLGRKLLDRAARPTPAQAADPGFALESLLPA